MFCVRGGAFQASRALRAEHENAGLRQIAFGDWERGVVAGFEASLHPSPPPRSHPPGYAELPRHENRTKSHERTACRERTISFTPADASRSPVLGCEKYFVSFRETFVFRAKRREARLGSALYGESPYFLRGLPSITFRDPAVSRYHCSVEMREGQAP